MTNVSDRDEVFHNISPRLRVLLVEYRSCHPIRDLNERSLELDTSMDNDRTPLLVLMMVAILSS